MEGEGEGRWRGNEGLRSESHPLRKRERERLMISGFGKGLFHYRGCFRLWN